MTADLLSPSSAMSSSITHLGDFITVFKYAFPHLNSN